MIKRRKFIASSAIISLAPTFPAILTRAAVANQWDSGGRILVVIQLDGGNDGINTVVPYRDEGYAKYRKELRLPDSQLIKLTDAFAFHASLRDVSELFEDGRLSIVHGVGYQNPNRSHFESMRIWHAGSTEQSIRKVGNGWIGDSLSQLNLRGELQAIHVGDESLPSALAGRQCTATTISHASDLSFQLQPAASDHSQPLGDVESNSLTDFLTRSVKDAQSAVEKIQSLLDSGLAGRYPATQLGERLSLVSRLIKAESGARVYYTTLPGFDTHAVQAGNHSNLLRDFSTALTAFMDDMLESKLDDRIAVLAFSEFGRRVEENASAGTDHGTAGPVFLAGNALASRTHGILPSLTDLQDGDLKHNIDFRSIYAAIAANWLGCDLPLTLKDIEPLPLFKLDHVDKTCEIAADP
ncbi:MAG: DUF1501 domain-containing protein [Planctomycetales bacterium]|nr:DUF1501 domain-containing protein [Planctomycetales bacterium]